MDEQNFALRNRVAVLGGSKVGKTAVLMRFLHQECPLDHHETVEDLYCGEYMVQGRIMKIDFLDTAGTLCFPAMRSLSIMTAQAFLLVYDINNEDSFIEMKRIWEEIKSVRRNKDNIPCVVIANKIDQENLRQVETFSGMDWAFAEGLQGVFLEVSAMKSTRIRDTFESLFNQFVADRSTIRVNADFIAKRFGSDMHEGQASRKATIKHWISSVLRGSVSKEDIHSEDEIEVHGNKVTGLNTITINKDKNRKKSTASIRRKIAIAEAPSAT